VPGHIGELEVALIAVQGVLGRPFVLGPLERGAVEEIEINVAVRVIVEQGQTRADGLH
jgi:hypothetical protein